ncbi:hypothetical protein Aph01nite_18170 [Acrocarpospora phusangensis]|uniref:Uncharacterized protein n=1 Tax=Acrocarpospora phusangensis TaxID=1070424 RepID=A0A919UMM3_9ACTN|nr:hypothetical protein [Acrocarpospora phusangensis]GIH23507.1 hypothetical protein Aph01nite_18170 [Acrocarpospora phusangensis]
MLGELARGRATRRSQAELRVVEALGRRGHTDVAAGLRALYADRPTGIEPLAAELGVGKGVLRDLLTTHGIALRPAGANTAAGRQARAHLNEQAAARRVGTPDLRTWLHERRREGWTLARLAAALGRSVPWVRARMTDL